jgi:hypothetical protein|tara:strand:- start:2583 stop:2786 length:204 start_codon:yes stop_codon:yes gene_type:complete
MKIGDLVYYVEQRMVEVEFIGIIISGPNYIPGRETSWKVWWMDQHNDDGSAKMGWWGDHRLRVINEG